EASKEAVLVRVQQRAPSDATPAGDRRFSPSALILLCLRYWRSSHGQHYQFPAPPPGGRGGIFAAFRFRLGRYAPASDAQEEDRRIHSRRPDGRSDARTWRDAKDPADL